MPDATKQDQRAAEQQSSSDEEDKGSYGVIYNVVPGAYVINHAIRDLYNKRCIHNKRPDLVNNDRDLWYYIRLGRDDPTLVWAVEHTDATKCYRLKPGSGAHVLVSDLRVERVDNKWGYEIVVKDDGSEEVRVLYG